MEDRDFIRETLRRIGETSITVAQEAAIMSEQDVNEPIHNSADVAFRRRAIVEHTLRLFGRETEMWEGNVYSDVFNACKALERERTPA